jgi:hypothetical protein
MLQNLKNKHLLKQRRNLKKRLKKNHKRNKKRLQRKR